MTPRTWLRRQYRRVRRIAGRLAGRGVPASDLPAANPLLTGTTSFAARVDAGEAVAAAALAAARECLAQDNLPAALRLGHELAGGRDTRQVGAAVIGLCRLHTSGPEQAWRRFAGITDPVVVAAAAPEYFEAGFVMDASAAEREARALPGLRNTDRPAPSGVLKVARTAFSVGRDDCAGMLIADGLSGTFGALTPHQAYEFDRLASWLPDGVRRRPPEPLDADLRFGVIDYKQPDNSSRNVGDFIQTLASLGHLVRHANLTFVGEPELLAFVEGLRTSVKPERLMNDTAAVVHLVEVQRDGNVYQTLPEPTWAVMFGWYLHPTFAGGYNLPFNPAIRPLFISFHLNKPEALTPEAVAYLRRYGPVGCRDWQTVALLAGAGIPAFFSGCITTTVDTVFARTGPDTRTATGYVDAREEVEGDDNIEQSVGDIRRDPLPTNLRLAHEWVSRYADDYREVVTSRLHSYLPARSVGCQVTFDPANRSDPRFGGLIDIDDAAYEAIRQGILSKLAAMVALLSSGANEADVYRRWRELCAPDVARAQEYLGSLTIAAEALPDVSEGLPRADRVVVIDAGRNQPAVARAVAGLERWAPGVPVVAVGAAATRLPARVHCVTDLPLVERGSAAQRHNLLVASVLASLPEGTRVLTLPPDALVRGPLETLFETDLGGAVVAARADVRRNRRNLAVLLRRISSRQGPAWSDALTLIAEGHRRIGHGHAPFDPRVAVLDISALAGSDWGRLARPLIETYGASWVEAMNVLLAGASEPLSPQMVGNAALEDVEGTAAVVTGLSQSRLPAAMFTRA